MGRPLRVCVIVIALLVLYIIWIHGSTAFKDRYNIRTNSEHEIGTNQVLDEEYVWISCLRDNPMYVNNDQVALKQFADDVGVKVTIEGTKEYDIAGLEKIIETVTQRRPSGIMIIGWDRALSRVVDKTIDAGIPTITVDADIIGSKRLAHVGSDWFNIGVKQAEALVKLIGGEGKVAAMGIIGADNMQQGFQGFKSVISNYPDITYLGEFDDMADPDESQRITEELLKEHPDIAGIAGFDVASGPGMGAAVKKAQAVERVKLTCVDMEPEHLRLCKEGVIQKLIGQKRKFFTYYGARLLYDYNHATISFSRQDEKLGIVRIPNKIDTGLIEIDINNVDNFLQ